MSKIDVVEIFRFNPPGVAPGMCLSGVYDVVTANFLHHVKNPKGFPVDPRRLANDAAGVPSLFDQQTEGNPPNGWLNPNDIKIHVGNDGKGNKICDRFITSFPHTVYGLGSPYFILTENKWDYVIKSVGQTKYILFDAVFVKDYGGDVGKTPAYLLQYFWGGRVDPNGKDQVKVQDPNTGTYALVKGHYSNREQYYYPKPFGLAEWNVSSLQPDGSYKITGDSGVSNKILPQSNWKDEHGKPYPMNYVNIPFMNPPA